MLQRLEQSVRAVLHARCVLLQEGFSPACISYLCDMRKACLNFCHDIGAVKAVVLFAGAAPFALDKRLGLAKAQFAAPCVLLLSSCFSSPVYPLLIVRPESLCLGCLWDLRTIH